MIIKVVTCLIVFFMIGGIFLLGRIEFDPEEENDQRKEKGSLK